MPSSDIAILKAAIHHRWPNTPRQKANSYIGQFRNPARVGAKITAQVEGNHGTYAVSILADEQGLTSAYSCYIGKGGYCHHCEALAITFLQDESAFREVIATSRKEVKSLNILQEYLRGVTLESLLKQLSENGITQKAFAESIGMSTRHLSAIKASELRNHYFHELGATKLACLWVLENLAKVKGVSDTRKRR